MSDVNSKAVANPEEAGSDENKIEIEIIPDEEGGGDLPAPASRDAWGSKLSYILSLIGYAVGFGNIWRFPYMMRENGGLAFLVPYCFMLATVGIPTFFLELAVGQRRRKGIIYCWKEISPAFGGLGICCAWICFLVGLYYNTLLAYCISYLVDSAYNPLPWTNCKTVSSNATLQRECMHELDNRATKYYWNRNTLGVSPGIDIPGTYNLWLAGYHVIAWGIIWAILIKGTSSVEMVVYFTSLFPYVVLIIFFIGNLVNEPSKGWLGAYRLLKPDWSFILKPKSWLLAGGQIFFSLGLGQGILVIFASYNPAKNNCHKDAVTISLINCSTSLFASLVVFPMIGAFGYRQWESCRAEVKEAFPSLNLWKKYPNEKFDMYFYTDAKDWDSVSETTPIYAKYGYGELLGGKLNLKEIKNKHNQVGGDLETIADISNVNSKYTSKNIADVARKYCSIGEAATASGGGTGFVFQGFTEASTQMKGSNFWSFMFFLMLFFLGIDSGFSTVEGAVVAIQDITRLKRPIATSLVCSILMITALAIFPFGWGTYVLDLMDQYTANWTLLTIALCECIAVAWVYGLATMAYDVRLMTGRKPNMYVLLCWKFITPIVVIILLVGSVTEFVLTTHGSGFQYKAFIPKKSVSNDGEIRVPYPWYSVFTGFFLIFFCMIWLPIQAVLRNTKFNLIRHEQPSYFPEDELRDERNINVEKEADQFTNAEKKIMGRQSLQNLQLHRNEVKKNKSQTSIKKRTSSATL